MNQLNSGKCCVATWTEHRDCKACPGLIPAVITQQTHAALLHCSTLAQAYAAMSSSRHNLSSGASFDDYDLSHPFAQGQFRYVAKGVYTNGPRQARQLFSTAQIHRCA